MAQTPDHTADNSAQFPTKNDLKSLTTSGSYLAARHASVERDATAAAAFYRHHGFEEFGGATRKLIVSIAKFTRVAG